jgi:hypothetical protein
MKNDNNEGKHGFTLLTIVCILAAYISLAV